MKAVFVYAVIQTMKKKNRRQFWTHPINNTRFLQGEFYTLYEDLKADDGKFFNYFRMSYPTFQELLARVTDGIKLQDTNMRPSIPPEDWPLTQLRAMADGSGACVRAYQDARVQTPIATSSQQGCARQEERARPCWLGRLHRIVRTCNPSCERSH